MLLLTGFQPFGGAEINPSAGVVEALLADPPAGIDLAAMVLPVETGVAAEALLAEIDRSGADTVVMLGEARGRSVISIEQVAVNLLDFSMPDNAGNRIEDRPIVAGGPDAVFSTLPVRRLVEGLREVGIPVERSLSAGTYLCNEISYRVLERHRTRGTDGLPGLRAGFVHLPSLPCQASTGTGASPSMSLDLEIEAVRRIVTALGGNGSTIG
ncbi:MAG: pyroglutamyl-peptidase I [Phycisphaera sp.]|nr:pyroglutamyl-peptidase I [Phycisphaera sp.]